MCSKTTIDFLSIASWNINGLYEKLGDNLFLNDLSKHDIVFLTETHQKNDDSISVEGYYYLHRNHHQPKVNGKIDGGIAMLCREHLKTGITIVNDENADYIWFRLDKDFFSLEKHLYICASYLPHEQSQYLLHREKDVIENIETDFADLSQNGYILLLGDLNARTGVLKDYVIDDCDLNVTDDDLYIVDENVGSRCNQDNVVNDRGTKLTELCIQSRLRILNGRTLGDSQGLFTCHRPQGSSTVDYMILSEEMIHRVQFFTVHDKRDLSDHCKISMQMKCRVRKPDAHKQINMSPMPPTFKWDESSIHNYQLALADREISTKITQFLAHTCTPDGDGTNLEAKLLNDIILCAASKSLKTRKIKTNNTVKTQPWYHPSLRNMRQRVNAMGHLIRQYPKDPHVTGKYYTLLKVYRRAVKYHKKIYKQDLITKLDNLRDSSPKEYWKLLNKLKKDNNGSDQTSQIDPGTWFTHFTKLNTKQHTRDYHNDATQTPYPHMISQILNKEIDISEVQKAIKSLKNGKSCGLDGISNEMLKYGQHALTKPLTKNFSNILKTGIYPKAWAQGYISPIYKSGNPFDPSNYRGITITSCVAKVFSSVMNNRLEEYLTENDTIHESQIAFKKKSRTSDHMFVLRTLIDKTVKSEKKPLYTCFVDFKKAFDSLPHGAMVHKLQANGINGNFLNIICDMYSKTSLRVKTQNQLTPTFPGEVGVRQGDILSPNLIKIFINDLPSSVISQHTAPPNLNSKPVGCLMYADDLVLLSESRDGLQTCLQKLAGYCNEWGLQINTNKTKVIVFNSKQRKPLEQFWLDDNSIECVDEYKYLGILFKSNGSFDTAQKNLYHRGLKAYFKMVKMLSTEHSTPNTTMHLFDHTVKPILLYASEIWGCIDPNLRRVKNNPESKLNKGYEKLWSEKLQLKMCRYLLGVNNKTSILAIRGETGRYPLYLDIATNILKYMNHLSCTNSDLLSQALQVNQDLVRQNKFCWLSWVNTLLQELGLDLNLIQQAPSRWLPKAKRTLHEKYFLLWKDQVHPSSDVSKSRNKLRTYQKFKTSLTRETYLDVVTDRSTRKHLAQLRTSSHKLHVETGRYNRLNISDRTCLVCVSNDVEDEVHFLTQCQAFTPHRDELFKEARLKCLHFDTLSDENKLVWLMSAEDKVIIHALAKYTHTCLTLRPEILRSNTA